METISITNQGAQVQLLPTGNGDLDGNNIVNGEIAYYGCADSALTTAITGNLRRNHSKRKVPMRGPGSIGSAGEKTLERQFIQVGESRLSGTVKKGQT